MRIAKHFDDFQLPAALNEALALMDYTTPTPVQAQAIPLALEGRDILGSAQTGTGKTGAFAIPVIARLMEDPQAAALILTPTRELATQITTVVHQMLKSKDGKQAKKEDRIRTALLIGGESMGRQFDQLRAGPRLIIGTPGRVNDHLRRNRGLLNDVKTVVLDEADRMLDMGFSVQIDEILKNVRSDERQTLMFSATFAKSIVQFAGRYLNDPQRISVAADNEAAKNIKHDILHVDDAGKYNALTEELDRRSGSVIVFVKTKHGADKLARKLEREEHNAGVIHGGLKQRQRDRAIAAFRNKKIRIMVATDVAARGLDVPHVEHVINFDLPQNPEDYIHRIGRTARAGAEGQALAFIIPSERGKWNAIDRILNPGSAPAARPAGSKPKGRGGDFKRGKKPFRKGNAANDQRQGERPQGNHGAPLRLDGEVRPRRSEGGNRFNNEGKSRPANHNGQRPAFKKRTDRPAQFRQKNDGNAPLKSSRPKARHKAAASA